MTTAIKFEHVKKAFADQVVVNDFNLNIEQGELFVLVGNSGSGKTTSIKMINRLEDPSSGRVLVNNQPTTDYNVQKLRWNIGYVLQQIALFPNMTVAKNIALISEIKGEVRGKEHEQREKIRKLLKQVNLDPDNYYDRYPRELSGGEQQRIGILRAIAFKPPIVLMDEPFSALDPLSRTNLQDLVIRFHRELHNTIVFVTHDMSEALKLADRIGVMKDGNLLQVAEPQEILRHPANQFVREFFQGSLGSDLYETPVRQAILFNSLNEHQEDKTKSVPTIGVDDKLVKLLALLSENPEIAVQGSNHEVLGYADRQWIIRYLSGINDFN